MGCDYYLKGEIIMTFRKGKDILQTEISII
jgi:hypothetical protein